MHRGPRSLSKMLAAAVPLLVAVLWSCHSRLPEPFTILCMGDSLTRSRYGYYPAYLRGFARRDGIKVRVVTAARPGDTSGEFLDFLKQTPVLKRVRPDLVVLMLGTNDVRIDGDATPLSRYRAQMEEIVRRIRATSSSRGAKIEIFLATIPPIMKLDLHTFDASSRRRVEEEIVPEIHRLAVKNGLHLLDVHAFFGEHPHLMTGVHPSRKGYYQMAAYIYARVRPFIEVS